MDIPNNHLEAQKLKERMLLTHFSMRYVIPIIVAHSESIRNHLLNLISWNEEARKEFAHHMQIYEGKVPVIDDQQMHDDAYPLRQINSELLAELEIATLQASLRERDLDAILAISGNPDGGWDEVVDIVLAGFERIERDKDKEILRLRQLLQGLWKEMGVQCYLPFPKKLYSEIVAEMKLLNEDKAKGPQIG